MYYPFYGFFPTVLREDGSFLLILAIHPMVKGGFKLFEKKNNTMKPLQRRINLALYRFGERSYEQKLYFPCFSFQFAQNLKGCYGTKSHPSYSPSLKRPFNCRYTLGKVVKTSTIPLPVFRAIGGNLLHC